MAMTRERAAELIRWARQKLYVAGRNDRLAAFRRREYRTLQEALATLEGEPYPVTDEDIDRALAEQEGA